MLIETKCCVFLSNCKTYVMSAKCITSTVLATCHVCIYSIGKNKCLAIMMHVHMHGKECAAVATELLLWHMLCHVCSYSTCVAQRNVLKTCIKIYKKGKPLQEH